MEWHDATQAPIVNAIRFNSEAVTNFRVTC